MHLFGLAIDINYKTNPYISQSANPIFRNAGLLVQGKAVEFKPNMSYDELQALDTLVEKYFSYLDNSAELEERLKEAKDAPWAGKSAAEAQAVIQKDLKKLAGKWERTTDLIKKNGFLNLKKELVEGTGLHWGGAGYGDMMHFDMRNKSNGAKIYAAGREYMKKKLKEANDNWPAGDHQ
jgi:hypothetical protein